LLKNIQDSIMRVSGDFRQKEILETWEREFAKTALETFHIISIKVDCTSGTYMRSLANSIGEKVGLTALAFGIKRIKVGEFMI
jgi:tRNA U55 pseudouridine synthase TruB